MINDVMVNDNASFRCHQLDSCMSFIILAVFLLQKKLHEVNAKFRLFQKPANFDQRLLECENALAAVKAQSGVFAVRSIEQDVLQAQLDECMVRAEDGSSNTTG